jgi:predicted transcriptional regulator
MTQILDAAASGGVAKTKIMCTAFLNYEQLKEYLVVLVERRLIDYDPKTLQYKTTSKGFQFLKIYNEIDEIMKVEV